MSPIVLAALLLPAAEPEFYKGVSLAAPPPKNPAMVKERTYGYQSYLSPREYFWMRNADGHGTWPPENAVNPTTPWDRLVAREVPQAGRYLTEAKKLIIDSVKHPSSVQWGRWNDGYEEYMVLLLNGSLWVRSKMTLKDRRGQQRSAHYQLLGTQGKVYAVVIGHFRSGTKLLNEKPPKAEPWQKVIDDPRGFMK
jgi:hypothetical protein